MSIFLPKNHLFNVISLIKLSKICFISQSKKNGNNLYSTLFVYTLFYISFIYLTIKKTLLSAKNQKYFSLK